MIRLEDVALARYRLAPHLTPTPLEGAPALGEQAWLKLENANKTHSFKVRGALNAMLALPPEARARGIVAASSGNHAQGVAYAAALLGVEARIVMPSGTARRKIAGVVRYGAEAILHGDVYDDAEHEARRLEQTGGLTYISPYNDAHVIAGGGTIGLEIYDVLPDVERVLVPVGGGGLISGIAVALKSLKPSVEVIGVNAAASPDMFNLIYGANHPLSHHTLADALPGEIEAGSITLDMTRRYVDRIVMVSEAAIAEAMRWMLSEQGWLAEGGGVVGIAALQSGVVPADRRTAIVVSGGNVDADVIAGILAGAQ
jgi:threonine dehydratase